ncbi:MAG TPA: dephospho-CoA kinase [Fibrobacter sp.]|nr:dephospho-CoA kinase [Fibrobacter sp.]
MLRIGITGLIGSGKSAVGRFLCQMGCPVLDADCLVHELYAYNSEVRLAIANRFGSEFLTPQGVDRIKMRSLIFNNTQARLDLEKILYPVLEKEQNRLLEEWAESSSFFPIAFVEAALLYKLPHFVKSLSAVWIVSAPDEVRLERLIARGLSKEDALARIALQKDVPLPQHEQIVYLSNEGSLVKLLQEVKKKLSFYQE